MRNPKYKFAVHTEYGLNDYETYEEAEEAARSRAFTKGADVLIYHAVAKANAPIQIKDVVVSAIT